MSEAQEWFLGAEVRIRMLGVQSITAIITDWNSIGLMVVHNNTMKFIPWLRVVELEMPKKEKAQ